MQSSRSTLTQQGDAAQDEGSFYALPSVFTALSQGTKSLHSPPWVEKNGNKKRKGFLLYLDYSLVKFLMVRTRKLGWLTLKGDIKLLSLHIQRGIQSIFNKSFPFTQSFPRKIHILNVSWSNSLLKTMTLASIMADSCMGRSLFISLVFPIVLIFLLWRSGQKCSQFPFYPAHPHQREHPSLTFTKRDVESSYEHRTETVA